MKALLVIFVIFGLNASAEEVVRSKPNAAGFPTKAGEYIHKRWKYVYEIQNSGTRSEMRIGRLWLEGKLVVGKPGALLEELFGRFIYSGDHGWNRGWLHTLTYDRPVFDKDGNPTNEARPLLPEEPNSTKTEPSGRLNALTRVSHR